MLEHVSVDRNVVPEVEVVQSVDKDGRIGRDAPHQQLLEIDPLLRGVVPGRAEIVDVDVLRPVALAKLALQQGREGLAVAHAGAGGRRAAEREDVHRLR